MKTIAKAVAVFVLLLSHQAWCALAASFITVGIAETCRGVSNHTVTADAVAAARFTEAGAVAFVIPRTLDKEALARVVSRIDALVLSGGEDVAPRRYNELPEPKLEKVNYERDAFEIALLDAARLRGIPIIGICRGCQMLNVYFGGSLHQDIGSEVPDMSVHRQADEPRTYIYHDVEAVEGSLVERLLAGKKAVYSWHHQAAKKVAPGFRTTARTKDGIVEAIESENAIGVQFHPEVVKNEADREFARKFFSGLVEWIRER